MDPDETLTLTLHLSKRIFSNNFLCDDRRRYYNNQNKNTNQKTLKS